MKKIATLSAFLVLTTVGMAQQKGITETGEEIVLYTNGTWKYLNDSLTEASVIPENDKKFLKPAKSTFQIKSNAVKNGFWINPKIWSFNKGVDNPEAEYEFKLKKGDLYAMIISEKVEIPLATLKQIALDNGRNAAPDLQIVKEEYRNVNGLKVLFLQMNGTFQGIKVSYYGYYYSDVNGTVQFISYTAQSLLEGYSQECEDLLNGLVSLEQ